MSWKAQIDETGKITRYKDSETGQSISAKEYERQAQMQMMPAYSPYPSMQTGQPMMPMYAGHPGAANAYPVQQMQTGRPIGQDLSQHLINQGIQQAPQAMPMQQMPMQAMPTQGMAVPGMQPMGQMGGAPGSPLVQPGAQMLGPGGALPVGAPNLNAPGVAMPPTAGLAVQGKNLRMEGVPGASAKGQLPVAHKSSHGFLDATSIAILLPTLVLLALIIAAAHKKRLFPWQTIRTFNPPSGLMTPRDYERSFVCPPNLRRHGRLGKKNPNSSWTDVDGVVIPFGFLARTHLPITIPMGRLPNKNMFIVAPSGSGKTTLMRSIMKALMAKPCVIIALEAKANDPNLDEKREGFKFSVLPEAQHAGFDTLYFNPLDEDSVHWNPLDLDPIVFASAICQDVNSLPPEEQHWAERDHGYIHGLAQILHWGAVQVTAEDENGSPSEFTQLPRNPRGLMKLVNNRRNIVESLRRLKSNPEVESAELSELTQKLSSIIRTDSDWDKNIQGIRGRLRMFNNKQVMRVTEQSNIDIHAAMHRPTVLIFGAPASMGPDAESLASCFVYTLQQALHTRYGSKNVLPLFAFFDEYQTLNLDIAGRLSAIVRGANGGLTVILQNVSQIANSSGATGDSSQSGMSELKTIFSNSAVRVCLHNADETTAKFFSEEIGKHAVIVPGIADHYAATGFGIFPNSWNKIHSQQVVARVDPDSIKRMEKQHALVFLAPAGDAEFGECKPMMVDLRGIEEIARLHLLHNVSRRGGVPMEGSVVPTEPGAPESPESPAAPHAPAMPEGAVPSFARGMGQAQAFVQDLAPAQFDPAAQQAAYGEPAQQMQPAASAQPAAQVATSARICPSCGKEAGQRKFCIECGHFMGVPQPVEQAQPQVELATSAAIVHPQPAADSSAPPFPSFVRREPVLNRSALLESPQAIADAAQSSYTQQAAAEPQPAAQQVPATNPKSPFQRRPMTSFNPDVSRFGFTPPGVEAQPQAQAPSPNQVEF
ncbi:MAG: type IV secretory system conjugative DNA transfer family protein [Candidatus Melainabacteria bacterium]|nr:type IV secretory system conjugative DNA transfer family protein [Candidatus Melainabacteria bacterium]